MSCLNKMCENPYDLTPSENNDLNPELEPNVDLEGDEEEDDETVSLYEHYKVVVDRGQAPLRVDKYLVDRMPNISRHRIQQAAKADAIFVGETPVKSNYKVKPLDVISLRLERPPFEFEIIKEDIPLNIVYEDEVLLVVNKEAGMVVHPGHGNYTGTMLNALAYYLKDDPNYDPSDPRLGLVHRIDKDTSGLLVVAKTPEAKADLSRQFFHKTTHRRYQALVWGRPQEKEGTIKGNIARDTKDRMQMAVYPYLSEHGKPAVTHYKLLEDLGYVALLECRLETGRTHQIRAHMKHLGHPLFADERYGGDRILRGLRTSKYKQFISNCMSLCPRQALHAAELGFVHPVSHETMSFSAPMPRDMQNLLEKWRRFAYEAKE